MILLVPLSRGYKPNATSSSGRCESGVWFVRDSVDGSQNARITSLPVHKPRRVRKLCAPSVLMLYVPAPQRHLPHDIRVMRRKGTQGACLFLALDSVNAATAEERQERCFRLERAIGFPYGVHADGGKAKPWFGERFVMPRRDEPHPPRENRLQVVRNLRLECLTALVHDGCAHGGAECGVAERRNAKVDQCVVRIDNPGEHRVIVRQPAYPGRVQRKAVHFHEE